MHAAFSIDGIRLSAIPWRKLSVCLQDLQVKSNPPVQTSPPINNDPAIIQVI